MSTERPNESPGCFGTAIYVVFHPIQSLYAFSRQIGTATELEAPPSLSTVEDFPNLPIDQAVKIIDQEKRK